MINKYRRKKRDFAFLKSKTLQKKYIDYLVDFDKEEKIENRIMSVSIYEKIDNNGMHKLIKRLRRIKDKEKLELPPSSMFKKKKIYILDAIEALSMFRLTSISFAHEWFEKIEIEGCHISNSEILLTTTFWFKKNRVKDSVDMHKFVISQNPHFRKFSFHSTHISNTEDMKSIKNYENDLFYDIIQDIYCSYLYAQEGKAYQLPIEICCFMPKYRNANGETINNDDYSKIIYYKEREHILIPRGDGRYCAFHYFGDYKDIWPVYPKYFLFYTKEMYYRVFYNIENKKIVQIMQKYLASRKKGVAVKDIKWFINNIRSIEEREELLENVIEDMKNSKRWKINENGTIKEGDLIASSRNTNEFRKNYRRNLEYLQSISSTRSNAIIYFVTIVSLIVSVISTIIAIISMG